MSFEIVLRCHSVYAS